MWREREQAGNVALDVGSTENESSAGTRKNLKNTNDCVVKKEKHTQEYLIMENCEKNLPSCIRIDAEHSNYSNLKITCE